MSAPYAQLDADALALLRAGIARHGSITAVARVLGYSRPAISMALAGRYSANVDALRVRILERLRDGVACPHLGLSLTADACQDLRSRPLTTGNPASIKQWQACRACPHHQHGGSHGG